MSGSDQGQATKVLTSQQSGARDTSQESASGNKESSQPEQAAALPVKQPPTSTEAAVTSRQAKTEQPSPYDLRDLTAQEDMAFWAMWMFVAAIATFAVTSIGTILIWRQVSLTGKAVADTGEATKAMREANEIARESADAQLRPYLGIEDIQPKSPDVHTRSIEIKIKNFGATPAENIKQEWGLAYVPSGIDNWPIFRGSVNLGREIAPGHYQRANINLSDWGPEILQVIEEKGAIRIVLRITYDGLGLSREPLMCRIVFSHLGAIVAIESMKGAIIAPT